ncbi:hypothetical protein LJC19_07835, partial [Oxalobacter sp. OttesenSCG-928-P03]|nr:hypothetical protein [Oxalobacter sp. OttesenSCG-928-P03]
SRKLMEIKETYYDTKKTCQLGSLAEKLIAFYRHKPNMSHRLQSMFYNKLHAAPCRAYLFNQTASLP